MLLPTEKIRAQCFGYNRIYVITEEANSNVNGTFLGLGDNTDVTNNAQALGNNLTNASSINLPNLGGTRYQRLKFPKTFTNGEPVHVKLSNTISLSLTGLTVTMQAYYNGLPVGTPANLTTAPFSNVLSGENIVDLMINNPGSAYDAVQISITNPPLSGGTVNIFAAYVNETATANIDCNTVADVLTGTTSGILSGVNSVTNPWNAVDNDLTTYAEVNQNLGAAGVVTLTTLFSSPSVAGDLVSVVFQVPGTLNLDAQVFTQLNVVAYLGNTKVASLPADATLIGLNLLDPTKQIYQFTYPVGAPFDRIAIEAGGIATAISQVYVYDVRKIIPPPMVLIDGLPTTTKSFCVGPSTIIKIDPIQNCNTYNWYNMATGGTIVHVGTSLTLTTPAVGTYTYYIEASRNGCIASVSSRTKVTITVYPLPTITLGADPDICIGILEAALPFTATTENPTSYSILWDNPIMSNVVDRPFPSSSPILLAISAAAPTGIYTGKITVKNGNSCSSIPINFKVTIHPKVASPTLIFSSN